MVVILPDVVVVRDRVTDSANPEFLLHTWQGNATVDSAEQIIQITDGTGHGWVKTLLPAPANLTVTTQELTQLIIVTPAMRKAAEVFLHVFYLSPSSNSFSPGDLLLVSEPSEQGIRLTDRQGNSWEVIFKDKTVYNNNN